MLFLPFAAASYYKIWKTRKKSKDFNRFQIEVFFLPNIRPPVYKPSPSPPEYRPIKFVLCPYMHPGRINEILR